MRIAPGSTDRSVYVHLSDASDGSDHTTASSSTSTLTYRRDNGSEVAVTLLDLMPFDTGHVDGGLRHHGGGLYRVDLPDAAFASGASVVSVHLSDTGAVQTGGPLQVDLDASTATVPDAVWGHATRTLTSFGLLVTSIRSNLLDLFRAITRSDAAAPADLGGTYDPATDSQQAIRDRGDAAWATADVSGLLTGDAYTASLPANFALLSIDASGQVPASNMRGTDGAYTGTPPTPPTATEIRQAITAYHGDGSYVDTGPATGFATPADLTAGVNVASIDGVSTAGMMEGVGVFSEEAVGNVETSAGSGARTVTVTVTDDAAAPAKIASATVRLTEPGGETFTATTNASGVAVFNVDDDPAWTVAITRRGYAFAGATLAVAGDVAQTYAMTSNATVASPDPGTCRCVAYFYEPDGTPLAGEQLRWRLWSLPDGATYGADAAWQYADESGSSGQATFDVIDGATVEYEWSQGRRKRVVADGGSDGLLELGAFYNVSDAG